MAKRACDRICRAEQKDGTQCGLAIDSMQQILALHNCKSILNRVSKRLGCNMTDPSLMTHHSHKNTVCLFSGEIFAGSARTCGIS